MEELTKAQLILLALLVSFVTSIATGIVTVTLVDQAPPGVTQTINRVVERTVEKVVPGQTASVVTKETTVVVKEENLIIAAVDKNSKNLVRIGISDKDGKQTLLGVGVIISSEGLVVTDSLNLTESKNYFVKTSGNKIFNASVENNNFSEGLALLKIIQDEKSETLVKFTKPSFGDARNLKLGQTVIALGGLESNSVATGIVSKLNKATEEISSLGEDGKSATTTIEVLKSIVSNSNFSADYSGGSLIDVDGFLLGINLKRKNGDISIPINIVLDITTKKLENTE